MWHSQFDTHYLIRFAITYTIFNWIFFRCWNTVLIQDEMRGCIQFCSVILIFHKGNHAEKHFTEILKQKSRIHKAPKEMLNTGCNILNTGLKNCGNVDFLYLVPAQWVSSLLLNLEQVVSMYFRMFTFQISCFMVF